MDKEMELPAGWKITKLGDFIISKKGKKPKYVSTERTDEFCIPYVNIKAFEKSIIDEYTNGEGCVFCEEDDFLMVWDGSRSGYVGRAIKGAIGSTLVKLSFPQEVFEKYAYYYLQSKYVEINTRGKGVGIPHVDPNLVWNYKFLLPPLPEQHHIVEKIEELFSELDIGIENLKISQQQLKVYRQAVLKWAFEGKLTNEHIKDGELPEGWRLLKISDVASINPKIPNRENVSDELEVQFLPMKLVDEESGKIKLVETKLYGEVKKGYTPFIDGDVIFAKVTPCMENGKIAVVKALKNGIGFGSSEFHVIRANANIKSEYLFRFLVQKRFRSEAENSMTGAVGLRRVPKQFVENYLMPIPSLKEQEKILLEIESRLSVCDKIEETITNSLQQTEALRQSILKKAFEGKLVQAEPKANIAQIVSINTKRTPQERKVLACYIIMMCYKDKFFGHTKFQKTLYLCEQYAQLDFDTNYLKKAAGPLDIPFFYPFLKEAKESLWLTEESVGPIIYFEPLDAIGSMTKQYPSFFKSVSYKISSVIKLLQGKNTDESELIATIYAIWNNYLIEERTLTREYLNKEVYDWSESKSKFKPQQIYSTWEWMKEVGLMPVGFGKLIQKVG